jgi:hypothetical protein
MKPTCICLAAGCCLVRESGNAYCESHQELNEAA